MQYKPRCLYTNKINKLRLPIHKNSNIFFKKSLIHIAIQYLLHSTSSKTKEKPKKFYILLVLSILALVKNTHLQDSQEYSLEDADLDFIYLKIEKFPSAFLHYPEEHYLLVVTPNWAHPDVPKIIYEINLNDPVRKIGKKLAFPPEIIEYSILIPQENKSLEMLINYFNTQEPKSEKEFFELNDFPTFKILFQKYKFVEYVRKRASIPIVKRKSLKKPKEGFIRVEGVLAGERKISELKFKILIELEVNIKPGEKGIGSRTTKLAFEATNEVLGLKTGFIRGENSVKPFRDLIYGTQEEDEEQQEEDEDTLDLNSILENEVENSFSEEELIEKDVNKASNKEKEPKELNEQDLNIKIEEPENYSLNVDETVLKSFNDDDNNNTGKTSEDGKKKVGGKMYGKKIAVIVSIISGIVFVAGGGLVAVKLIKRQKKE